MPTSARFAVGLFFVFLLTCPLWMATGAYLSERTEPVRTRPLARASQAQLDSLAAEFSAHLITREQRVVRTPRLTKREKRALRRSSYDRHRQLSQTHGVPLQPRKLRHTIPDGLKSFPEESVHYVQHDGTGMLAPAAIEALTVLGERFHQLLAEEGLPLVRFSISSAYRSSYNQHRLRNRNRNATRGVSSHEYGGSFDVTYKRFAAPVRTAPTGGYRIGLGFPILSTATSRKSFAQQELEWGAQMASRYPSRFAALLGRALIQLEDEGVLVVLREVRQPCYHITVGKPVAQVKA